MKKTLTIQAIIDIYKGIASVQAVYNDLEIIKKYGLPDRRLTHAMTRTKSRLKEVWDAAVEMEKPLPAMEAFNSKAREVAGGETGPEAEKKINALADGEFKDLFDAEKLRRKAMIEHLKTEEEIDFFTVSREVFDKAEIPPLAYEQLQPMVEDAPEKKDG